jgi:hypothetical protein
VQTRQANSPIRMRVFTMFLRLQTRREVEPQEAWGGRLAELVDAPDLESGGLTSPYEFDPRGGHPKPPGFMAKGTCDEVDAVGRRPDNRG